MDTKKITKEMFVKNLIDEFRCFVADSMEDGMHDDFDDHYNFLQAAMETFCQVHEDMNDEATSGQVVRPFGQ